MAITKGIYICADEPTEPSADMFLEPGSFTSNNKSSCFEIQYNSTARKLFYNTFGDDSYEVYNYATKTWTNNAWKTIDITSTNSAGNDWFFANYTKQTTKLSIDLTTLPGWANLSSGNHTIKIKAKGTGYIDSELSSGVVVSKAAEVYTDCLTFTGESSEFTLKPQYQKAWDGTLYYSTDHNTWNVWNGEEISSANKKLYLKGKGNTKFEIYDDNAEDFYYAEFRLSAKASCSGNIQTLLDWENPPTSIPSDDCFNRMFYGCTNLTAAPELPATTLAPYCYYRMFGDCTNLTTAPNLPATTLTENCYDGMFVDCTSLTSAPELPATALVEYCYANMFDGCTKLKVNTSSGNKIFTCPATIPKGAVNRMFGSTGGSFTGEPTAGNTYYWTE